MEVIQNQHKIIGDAGQSINKTGQHVIGIHVGGTQQVMLKVRFAEVQREVIKNLAGGIEFLNGSGDFGGTFGGAITGAGGGTLAYKLAPAGKKIPPGA